MEIGESIKSGKYTLQLRRVAEMSPTSIVNGVLQPPFITLEFKDADELKGRYDTFKAAVRRNPELRAVEVHRQVNHHKGTYMLFLWRRKDGKKGD